MHGGRHDAACEGFNAAPVTGPHITTPRAIVEPTAVPWRRIGFLGDVPGWLTNKHIFLPQS